MTLPIGTRSPEASAAASANAAHIGRDPTLRACAAPGSAPALLPFRHLRRALFDEAPHLGDVLAHAVDRLEVEIHADQHAVRDAADVTDDRHAEARRRGTRQPE